MTLAVDFGTSNTVVARWNEATEQAETLTLGNPSIAAAATATVVVVANAIAAAAPRAAGLCSHLVFRWIGARIPEQCFCHACAAGAKIQATAPKRFALVHA